MRALERYLLLQIIDQRWREHLYDMDYLREGIHLRGFAQIDPLVAYKNEAFTLFHDLMNTIWSDFARMIYNVEVEVEGEDGDGAGRPPRRRAGQRDGRRGGVSYSGGRRRPAQPRRATAAAGGHGGDAVGPAGRGGARVVQQRRVDEAEQIGRNDPCWCGVGQEVQEVPRRLT